MNILRHSARTLFATALSLGLLFLLAGTVSAHTAIPAHAKVDSSNPKMDSTISTPPTTVNVHTVENMKPGAQNSNLFVYGPSGDLISQGDAKIDLNNPQQMSVTIKPEKDGVYVVRWITVSSDDGDPDQGAFIFTVNSKAASTTTTSTTATSTTPATGTPIWVPIVVGIVALLLGLAAGVGLGRRRTAPAIVPSTTPTTAEQEKTTTNRP